MSEIITGVRPDETNDKEKILETTAHARKDITAYLDAAASAMEAIQSPEWGLLNSDVETVKNVVGKVDFAFGFYLKMMASIHNLLNTGNSNVRNIAVNFEQGYSSNKEISQITTAAQGEIAFLTQRPESAGSAADIGLKNSYELFEMTTVMAADVLDDLVTIEQQIF